jgi:hypothetical protein
VPIRAARHRRFDREPARQNDDRTKDPQQWLVGCNFSVSAVTRYDAVPENGRMLMRTVAFIVVRRVLSLVGLGPAPEAKDVEIAVLRHQLMVLQRQIARPLYAPSDRLILATLDALPPSRT